MKNAERPYRIWGHPVITVVFIAFTLFYLIVTLKNDVANYLDHRQPVINSLLGIVIVCVGIPLFFYFKRKKKTDTTNQVK